MCALREFLLGLISGFFICPWKRWGGMDAKLGIQLWVDITVFIFFIVDRLTGAKGKRGYTEEPRQAALFQ